MIRIMGALQDLIATKESDIANEKKTLTEVMDVRSKLRDGTIADNLDKLVEQKQSVVVIEQELVSDLSEFRRDLQNLVEGARDRASRTRQTLEAISRPDTEFLTPYDWRDIEEMELMFQQTADSVAGVEERIRELSQRIDDARFSRAVVLGEDVPVGPSKTAQRAGALVGADGLALEERIIASSIAEAKVLSTAKRTYESIRENLRESQSETQTQLNRFAYEKEKAAEKIARIKSKMEEEIRTVEDQVGTKLDETQVRIDEEARSCC